MTKKKIKKCCQIFKFKKKYIGVWNQSIQDVMYMEFKLKRIHLKGQIKITLIGESLMFLFYR